MEYLMFKENLSKDKWNDRLKLLAKCTMKVIMMT